MRIVITCLVLFIAFSSFSQSFSLSDTQFSVGSICRRYNIYFDLGKAHLQDKCFSTLDSFADFMTHHPNLTIEIGVHSDTRGSNTSSSNLTQARAKSIRDYLVGKKIAESRLKAVGYGESKLLVKDEQINGMKTVEEKEANHQLNRRVEFKIIAIN